MFAESLKNAFSLEHMKGGQRIFQILSTEMLFLGALSTNKSKKWSICKNLLSVFRVHQSMGSPLNHEQNIWQ